MAVQRNNSNAGVLTFKAGASGTFSMTLPSGTPSSGQGLSTNASGVLSFAAAGSLAGVSFGSSTTGTNSTINVSSMTSSAATTSGSVTFQPKVTGQTGIFLNCVPDGAATGGTARSAINLFDVTFSRSLTTSGNYATGTNNIWIIGGQNNAIDNQTNQALYIGVIGGANNTFKQGGGTFPTRAGLIGGSNNSTNNQGTGPPFAVNMWILGGDSSDSVCTYGLSLAPQRSINCTAGGILFGSPLPSGLSTYGRNQVIWSLGAAVTGDATATVMTAGDASSGGDFWFITPNVSALFTAKIVAIDRGNLNSKCWLMQGTVQNNSNGTTIVLLGSTTITSPFADTGASTWTVNTPNVYNKATTGGLYAGMYFSVTGQASRTIAWSAAVEYVYASPA